MNLVVSQLVFASSTKGTTEILHDRRKVMVRSFFFSYACSYQQAKNG